MWYKNPTEELLRTLPLNIAAFSSSNQQWYRIMMDEKTSKRCWFSFPENIEVENLPSDAILLQMEAV